MSGVYQHFRPEEKEFIDQVLDWRQSVEDFYSPKLTDFLDPRQQLIVSSLIGENNDVRCSFFGGSEESERKRAIIYPEYYEPSLEDFQVGLYEIDYPRKFIQLDHRTVLGTIMSLGLKRDKFGDIIVSGDRIQLLLAEEIEDFILTQLTQMGRANVSIQKKAEKPIESDEKWHESEKTASSLRLDTIVATAYNLSRQKAQTLIQQGLARVNWEKIEQPSYECMAGDVLSVRGFGRSKMIAIHGKTKKDKWRITIGILK
ncbi:RNA-binding protein [Bacillus sp. FJAT-50079]|uniref:YlmH family RNA-binding protein n=1 Tax=Bacillus sp. FJAT-50079 TaxID=2833577 RepID=UPI001BCA607A|nr:RNA-binding protein [Bacillus sp. FJAT-50079]MBS4207696.1 RNA-binding protein [Bacillus sp. FJAT-50079]